MVVLLRESRSSPYQWTDIASLQPSHFASGYARGFELYFKKGETSNNFFINVSFNIGEVCPAGMKKKYKLLIFIAILVLFIGLNQLRASDFLQNNFYKISSPLNKFFWRAGNSVSDILTIPLKVKALQQENKSLNEQNILLKQKISQTYGLSQENEILKTALKFSQESKLNLIMANVLSYDGSAGKVIISKGRQDGIYEDMPVITQEGALVGSISKALDDFSEVFLITSPENSFEIEIQSREIVLAAGRGKGQTVGFTLAPQNILIAPGDLVRTTAQEGKFPKGILVGEVSEIKNNQADAFQEGQITPYFTPRNLNILFIVL